MSALILLAVVLAGALATGLVANERGRNGWGWGAFAFFSVLWPLVLAAVLVLGPTDAERERRVERDEAMRRRVRDRLDGGGRS